KVSGDGPFQLVSVPEDIKLAGSEHKKLRLLVAYKADEAPLGSKPFKFVITNKNDPSMKREVESVFTFPIE
ncbi:MAG: hypothetical protein KDK37_15185, partial [Leptospiraceae bacterium]|nr:hypothetical protein [Leptospiraceae bacterium]